MTERRRTITAQGPTPRLLVFIAMIAIFTAGLAWVGHISPSAIVEREANGATGEDALRRAQRLLNQLDPDEPAPPLRVTYNSVKSPLRPGERAGAEEIVVASAETETTARFILIVNSRTAHIRRLTWARVSPTPRSAVGESGAGEGEILDHARAVIVARRCLRVAGVADAAEAWRAVDVHRVPVNPHAGVRPVWQVKLTSPHGMYRIVLDSVTAAPTQLLLLARGNS
jgi:hypothetical protein